MILQYKLNVLKYIVEDQFSYKFYYDNNGKSYYFFYEKGLSPRELIVRENGYYLMFQIYIKLYDCEKFIKFLRTIKSTKHRYKYNIDNEYYMYFNNRLYMNWNKEFYKYDEYALKCCCPNVKLKLNDILILIYALQDSVIIKNYYDERL